MFTQGSSFNVFYSENLQITKEFYSLIGAEIKKVESDKIVVGISDFDIHIILSSTEPSQDYKFMAESSNKGGSAIFYSEVDSLNDLFIKIKSSTGRIKSEIYNNHWGAAEFLCEDPDGYKFAFYQMI